MRKIHLLLPYEYQMEERRVVIYNLDWQRRLVGKMIKIEEDLYWLQLDDGRVTGILRQSVGIITTAPEEGHVW